MNIFIIYEVLVDCEGNKNLTGFDLDLELDNKRSFFE